MSGLTIQRDSELVNTCDRSHLLQVVQVSIPQKRSPTHPRTFCFSQPTPKTQRRPIYCRSQGSYRITHKRSRPWSLFLKSRFDSRQGARDISHATSIRAINSTQLPSQTATALFPWGQNSIPSSREVRNEWRFASTAPYAFLAYEGTASYLLLLFPSQMSSHHQEIQALRSEGFGRGNILFRVAPCWNGLRCWRFGRTCYLHLNGGSVEHKNVVPLSNGTETPKQRNSHATEYCYVRSSKSNSYIQTYDTRSLYF
jgi:hypothetical protein